MRRSIGLAVGIFALLTLLDVAAWQILTHRMRSAWDDFVVRHRAAGWQVAAGEPVAEGFPLVARLRIESVEIAHESQPIPGGMSAGAEILTLELPFTAPTHVVVRPQGAMHLRVGAGPDVDFTAQNLTLRGALAGHEADLVGSKLQTETPFGTLMIDAVQAALVQPDLGAPLNGNLTIGLDGINLPPRSSAKLLGPTVEHANVDVALANTVLTIRALNLNWGKLAVTGQGVAQPDQFGQPSGDAKIRIVGAVDTLDVLVNTGQIAPRDAATAKTVLAFLQRPGPDGKPAVELPVKVANRTLMLGGFPVMRLPEVHLPIPATQTPQ